MGAPFRAGEIAENRGREFAPLSARARRRRVADRNGGLDEPQLWVRSANKNMRARKQDFVKGPARRSLRIYAARPADLQEARGEPTRRANTNARVWRPDMTCTAGKTSLANQ